MNILNFIQASINPQKNACDTIQKSDYWINELPKDFDSKPLGTFAITPGDLENIFNIFYLDIISNNKKSIRIDLIVKENGEFEINNASSYDDINKLLYSLNNEKVFIGIPLKLLIDLKDVYKQDSIQNIISDLQIVKTLCDKQILGNKDKLNLPFVIHPSILKQNCLVLSYYKMFEGLFYIDHVCLEYKFNEGLIYLDKKKINHEEIEKTIFTDQNFYYPSLIQLENEKLNIEEKKEGKILKIVYSNLKFTNLQKIKDNKYYWMKKNSRDITRLLKDNYTDGSFIFYEKRNCKPMIAYLKENEVCHRELKFPMEPIYDFDKAVPFTETNLAHLVELKDNRLYSANEVKKSLRKELEDAQRSQNEQKDNPLFNAQSIKEDSTKIPDLHADGKEISGIALGIACSKGRRELMEDKYFAKVISFKAQNKSYNASLFGVFDGHGSDACAKYIATHIEETFIARLQEHNKDQLNEINIFNAIAMAFVDLSKNYTGESDGSTATTAFLLENDVYIANVGDSRTLMAVNGEALALSVDAKPQVEKFKAEIEQRGGEVDFTAGAYRVGHRVAIARAIGDKQIKGITARPTITKITLEKTKPYQIRHLVLGSDGLFDVCSSKQAAKEVYKLFKEGKTSRDIAELLMHAAYKAGSKDNITVMILYMP